MSQCVFIGNHHREGTLWWTEPVVTFFFCEPSKHKELHLSIVAKWLQYEKLVQHHVSKDSATATVAPQQEVAAHLCQV